LHSWLPESDEIVILNFDKLEQETWEEVKTVTDQTRDEAVKAARSQVLTATKQGPLEGERLQSAIATLEKAQLRGDLQLLPGEWQLLWTSGTRKAQQFKLTGGQINSKPIAQVVQRINIQPRWFENQVRFPGGSLIVEGPFEYRQHRLEFRFERVRLQLGTRRLLQLPLGKWATGWLQTTYLDQDLHLERGDRGGISAYIRVGSSTPTVSEDNDRIIL
jgi:hypothetical protein